MTVATMTEPPLDLSVSDGRRRTAVAAANWLAALLAEGPVESREVLAKGAEAGLSPKALRHARESLQLRVVRTGVRQTMKTTWSLPCEANAEDEPGTNDSVAKPPTTRAGARAYISPTIGEARDTAAQLTHGEQRRIERRVVYFTAKGMPDTEARDLAVHLVLERDRMPELGTSGSCVECENYRRDGSCLATAEVGVHPRPARAVWFCWYARRPVA